jgi:hypothetical protein
MKLPVGTLAIGSWPRSKTSAKVPLSAMKMNLAFMNLGYHEEARAWRDWLVRAVAGSPSQVQILYGIGGERWLPELIVPWLSGYETSAPVRIGNDASQQLQLDVFGEIADAMFQALKAGMAPSERGQALRPVVLDVAATGRRHLGGARRTAALHSFEGHGLGRGECRK